MTKTTKDDKALPGADLDQRQRNADAQRKFFEEIAAKLIGDQKAEPDWENPVALNWNERMMAAEALLYVAKNVITGEVKPKRGNPKMPRKFDHEFAAILFGIYSNQNMKPEAAYAEIAKHLSTADNTIDANAVRMAIRPNREDALSLAKTLNIKVRDNKGNK